MIYRLLMLFGIVTRREEESLYLVALIVLLHSQLRNFASVPRFMLA